MKSIFILFDNIVSLYIWVLIINVIMSWLVAFNIIRDTLAGTVNSLFGIVNKEGVGFVPGWTTVGGLITFQGTLV